MTADTPNPAGSPAPSTFSESSPTPGSNGSVPASGTAPPETSAADLANGEHAEAAGNAGAVDAQTVAEAPAAQAAPSAEAQSSPPEASSKSVGEQSAGPSSAAGQAGAEDSGGGAPTAEGSGAETPTAEAPTAEGPTAEGSGAGTPTAEGSRAEAPAAEARESAAGTPLPESEPAAGSDGGAAAAAAEPPPASAKDSTAPEGGKAPSGQAAADGEGGAKKKRRRRRKRKSGGNEESTGRPQAAERAPFHVGEEVFGRVTAVLDSAIMVDLAGKALAIFDRSEMEEDDLLPAVGDRFVAAVLRDGSRGGLVVLSRKPLREELVKPAIAEAAKSGSLVQGLVTGVIKGGVEVSLHGLRAFAPASGMDLHPQNANFTSLLGQSLEFKVTQCDEKCRDVVVTRRPMLEAEAHERRKRALTLLQEGQVMKGVIRTLVEWGAFAALPEAEGLEGLVHISEASHDPKAKITDLFKPGQDIEVQITKIDDRGKIWLSRKALLEDPWAEAKKKYAPGQKLTAKVTRAEQFGVFVELDSDIDGLIHVSDLTAAPQYGYKKVEHPKDIAPVGTELDVVVHHFDARNRKVSLHVALPEDKRAEKPQKVARNASLEAEVIRAESAGLVVRVLGVTGRSSRGFIPAGQTGTAPGTDLRKRFKAGTLLSAKVIDLDPRRPEPKLSIKMQAQDEERRAHREYRKKFAQEANFGTLGDLLAAKLK